ncbi:DUF2812 domain-containing protein [Paenibacillus puerhi]|uniref:DUF2812 domain-containing protein n=1 Tax=Paenibacillus puerhi TaxID=2692622 RepID=UPI00135C9EA4|nr:DUF2812 domain-containing protein [Paenibacillus puerhi]
MARQTRYMGSAGLAFAEYREMNKLSKLSEQGWFLEKFAFFGYKLRKGTPRKLIYCLDIRSLEADERSGYMDIFEAGGWRHVCSAGDLHIFAAEPGTESIYTDHSTTYEKYMRALRSFKALMLVMLAVTAAGLGISYMAEEVWSHDTARLISIVALSVSSALLVPSVMVYTAYWLRVRKLRSRI